MKKQSGVNTAIGSTCSKTAFEWAKKSFTLRKGRAGRYVPTIDGSYAATLDFHGTRMGMSSDGIGTKIEIAERVGVYDTLGFDLLAMTIDDLVSNGYEPAIISNILDVDFLDHAIVDELMKGLYNACKFANVTVSGGEIAELGSRISGFGKKMHFNWCATGIGALHENVLNPVTGKDIKAGDIIISVYNPGFRSNGFSLVRQILANKYGETWHKKKVSDTGEFWGLAALQPCLIYSPLIIRLLDSKIIPHGIAHITGGGIVDNLGRVLKLNKLGAHLHNLHGPDPAMAELLRLGKVPEEKAYRYWNMGNGMMLVVAEENVSQAMNIMRKNKKYQVCIAGEVTEKQQIEIVTESKTLQFTQYDTK